MPRLNYVLQKYWPDSMVNISARGYAEVFSNVAYLDTENETLLSIIMDDTDNPLKNTG